MNSQRPHLFGLLAGLFLAAGLCFATLIAARAWMKVHETQQIDVTGSARKDVKSDLAIWSISFATTDKNSLAKAHENSKTKLAEVEKFLKDAGQKNYYVKPVEAREIHETVRESDGSQRRVFTGYQIAQNIEVRSGDVDSLPKLASDSARLIEKGIMLSTDKMQFIYTKAGEEKISMMGEAAKDARARAEQIAAQGDRKVRSIRNARMGVVQINPIHSTSTSWEGNNDTSSLEKTIITTVSATFDLE